MQRYETSTLPEVTPCVTSAAGGDRDRLAGTLLQLSDVGLECVERLPLASVARDSGDVLLVQGDVRRVGVHRVPQLVLSRGEVILAGVASLDATLVIRELAGGDGEGGGVVIHHALFRLPVELVVDEVEVPPGLLSELVGRGLGRLRLLQGLVGRGLGAAVHDEQHDEHDDEQHGDDREQDRQPDRHAPHRGHPAPLSARTRGPVRGRRVPLLEQPRRNARGVGRRDAGGHEVRLEGGLVPARRQAAQDVGGDEIDGGGGDASEDELLANLSMGHHRERLPARFAQKRNGAECPGGTCPRGALSLWITP
ncbi:MAG: hypothetical protein AUJ37_01120 [Candidatus Magasanikbacteria bacterium CG1_02_41_34]|nr:MAG: hypothetical protein AUJ37_01120 [Candidatus Magasanikbacteria bacterium CG1_02_41_34]